MGEPGQGRFLYAVDSESRIRAARGCELLGYTERDLLGQSALRTFRPDLTEGWRRDWFEHVKQSTDWQPTTVSFVLHRDGHRVSVQGAMKWLPDSGLLVVEYIVLADILDPISNVSKIVRLVEVPPEAYDDVLAGQFVNGENQARLASELTHLEDALRGLEDTLRLVKERAGVARPRTSRRRGPYEGKPYSDRDIFIEDVNGAYLKWRRMLAGGRPRLMLYLCQQTGLPEWTLRRRLREYELHLNGLPWTG
jgi:hypothetical protein